MYKILSIFGHQGVNNLILERLGERISLVELPILNLESLYKAYSDDYDIVIFRDGAMEIKLNMISILKKLKEINPNTQLILILENQYEFQIEQALKSEKEAIIFRNTDINNLVNCLTNLLNKKDELLLCDSEEEEGDDFVFDLNTMEEEIIENTNVNTIVNENKPKQSVEIFPIQDLTSTKGKDILLYMVDHSLLSQVALQLANKISESKEVLYLEFIKPNYALAASVTNQKLTMLNLETECNTDNILNLYRQYKKNKDTLLIINTNYDKRLINLLPFSEITIEILQDDFSINKLASDIARQLEPETINISVSYFEDKLIGLKQIKQTLNQNIIPIRNTRGLEYNAYKNLSLYKGDEGGN